jgi:peptidyl-prolyl cis-trans isomerase D
MLSFFRGLTKSKYGVVVVFIFLGVIALAFAAGDVSGLRTGNPGSSGPALAKVGDAVLSASDVRTRIDAMLTRIRREGRPVSMEDFINQGGLEAAIEQSINGLALEEFAKQSGIRVSKALIDGEIASNPAFQGPDGKFSQVKFEQVLRDVGLNPKVLRDDMTRSRYGSWLLDRASPGTQMPAGVIAPYASLLLERRIGIAGMVRTIDMDPGADPDDKALTDFYNKNRARYMIPERRVLRYTIVLPEMLKAQAAATEADIATAYRAAGARYAARETRTVQQVVVMDQATANKLAGQIRGGQAVGDAARGAGLESSNFNAVEKADLAQQTAPAIANAAFGAAQGTVVGPIRSPLGWHVLKVEKIEQVAAKTLDQARAELTTEIGTRKLAQSMIDTRQKLEDGIGDGQTFDELMASNKLTAARTPALTAQGVNPDDAAFKPDPTLGPIVQQGFTIEPDNQEPAVVAVSQDGAFAVVGLERVVPAAPRPLADIRDQVKRDYLVDKALAKARETANGIVKKLESGVPMARALAESGITTPPAKPFDMKRSELIGQRVPPQVAMAFQRTRAEFAPALPREREQQFVQAIRRFLKVEKNDKAIAAFKASLTGAPAN